MKQDSDISTPAAARAYRALEHLIVTLALAPGEVTTENRLIARVGLGRTPVREAVQRLQWEGLVEVRPRAGMAIAALDAADWMRVLEAREGVEIVLARRAATRGADPAALEHAADYMKQAVHSSDIELFLAADKLLDETVAAVADNDFAARLAAPLQTHSRRFWFRYRRLDNLADAADHHLAIIRAIRDRNPDRAAADTAALMSLLRRQAEAASD